jgi:threonine synthase
VSHIRRLSNDGPDPEHVETGVVGPDERVVCLTTGHLLKDPDAAAAAGAEPEPVPGDTEGVLEHLT